MKTIGLLGGMSWESTVPYYQAVNQRVAARLGGLHSAKVVLYSVDFHEIETVQHAGQWDQAGERLAEAGRSLERAGADFIVICTNTMHKVAPAIENAVAIPLLHIATPTARAIQAAGLGRIGLLGTAFTMEQTFYRGHLESEFGLEVIVPEARERAAVHRIIYEELCRGVIRAESRDTYREIMDGLARQGAEGIILGCTEISLLVGPDDASVPLFDTTALHATAAADYALGDAGEAPDAAAATASDVVGA